MITIFDNRNADEILLKDVYEGECFVLMGTLYRKLYEKFDDDIDCEYMYSGKRTMLHKHTLVVPVDVSISYRETEDYER